jgi:hypothetical protein
LAAGKTLGRRRLYNFVAAARFFGSDTSSLVGSIVHRIECKVSTTTALNPTLPKAESLRCAMAEPNSLPPKVPSGHVEEEIHVPTGGASGATEGEDMAAALQSYVPGTEEEKRLVRKIDFVMLPCLWWMYILAYLDRGNIVSIFPQPTTAQRINMGSGKRKCCWIERRPSPFRLPYVPFLSYRCPAINPKCLVQNTLCSSRSSSSDTSYAKSRPT